MGSLSSLPALTCQGAVFIPTNPIHSILKVPWSRPSLRIGRGAPPLAANDVVLHEKRVSNTHCRITLGVQAADGLEGSSTSAESWQARDAAPDVWIEDLNSSNGTFVSHFKCIPYHQVNGSRISGRRLLVHGDEISLGHHAHIISHDVRYIFRSVGPREAKLGSANGGGVARVGEVYERYQILQEWVHEFADEVAENSDWARGLSRLYFAQWIQRPVSCARSRQVCRARLALI